MAPRSAWSAKFSEKVKGVSTKTVKLYKDGKKTKIKAKEDLKKGKKLKIVNKGKRDLPSATSTW